MTKESFLACLQNNQREYGKYGLIISDHDHRELAESSSFKIFLRHLETFYELNEQEKSLLKSKIRTFRIYFNKMKQGTTVLQKKDAKQKKKDKSAGFSFTKTAYTDAEKGGGLTAH